EVRNVHLTAATIAALGASLNQNSFSIIVSAAYSHFPGCNAAPRGTVYFDAMATDAPWKNLSAVQGCASSPFQPSCKNRYLVLVHGMGSSVEKAFADPATGKPCAPEIMAAGGYDQVLGFDYDWTSGIDGSGAKLGQFLEAIHACCAEAEVDIEAHSEGVPVSLSALSNLSFNVGRFIPVAGPILGTPAANDAAALQTVMAYLSPAAVLPTCGNPLLQALAGRFAADLRPNSQVLTTNLAKVIGNPHLDMRVISAVGSAPINAFLNIFSGAWFGDTCNDGVVACEAADSDGKGFDDSISAQFNLSHSKLTCNPEVITWIGEQVGGAAGCTYTYSPWSPCQNNTQTRTVIASSPPGCRGTPVLTQPCTSTGRYSYCIWEWHWIYP